MGKASTVQRRLAAILCADVAGYSRLMNLDEDGTLRLLAAHRETADRLIARHGGRIANTAGDSILAEFPSAVDALQCAVDIQEGAAALNEEVAEERRVRFRIGVHVGEAMVRDGDMFGDAVNVAARMESLAEPGSVCLSATAHEFAHKSLPLVFEDLGAQQVKNIEAPVRAYLARPAHQTRSSALPPVHRRVDFHLARRFHSVCVSVLEDVTRPEGLMPADPAVLASLADAPHIGERELAERIGIAPAKLRPMLRRLEARGLMVRNGPAARARAATFALTVEGTALQRRLHQAVLAAQERVMTPLSDAERETLRDLLARIIKAHAAGSDDKVKFEDARSAPQS